MQVTIPSNNKIAERLVSYGRDFLGLSADAVTINADDGCTDFDAYAALSEMAKDVKKQKLIPATEDEAELARTFCQEAVKFGAAAPDAAFLERVNEHLSGNTVIGGSGTQVTAADLAVLSTLESVADVAGVLSSWKYANVSRWFAFVSARIAELKMATALADLSLDPPFHGLTGEGAAPAAAAAAGKAAAAPKAAKKEEGDSKAAAKKEGGAENQKKEKKEKKKKEKKPQAPPKAAELNPHDLDIRVGQIVRVWRHPEADKLYCEEIDVGEEKPRTICSGLVDFIPQNEMENARVMVLCNLKPVKMRGVESAGMVLCGSSDDHSKVALVKPAPSAKVGDRVTFPGFEETAPPMPIPGKRAPKLLADLHTDGAGVACWKDAVWVLKSAAEEKCVCTEFPNTPIK